jgi:hypothetical protein
MVMSTPMGPESEARPVGGRRDVGRALAAVEQRDLAEQLAPQHGLTAADGQLISTSPVSTTSIELPGSPIRKIRSPAL